MDRQPAEVDQPARIVLLNGPSSSGKSTVGRAMLPLLEVPWFLVPVDLISGMRSTVQKHELDEAGVQEVLRRTRLGYHRTIAALASAGNDVIMDYPLSEAWRLTDLLNVLDGYDVTLVDVPCANSELARRERSRGDRPVGLAVSQRVFDHGDCDLAIDTTETSAHKCAEAIVGSLDTDPSQSVRAVEVTDRIERSDLSLPVTDARRSFHRQ